MLELGKREREIMEAIYSLGRASVREVHAALADPPSYSAVRAMMGILEDKGLLQHQHEGRRYIYSPAQPRIKAQQSTLKRIVSGLFGNSTKDAMHTLIDLDEDGLSDQDLDALLQRIETIRKNRKNG